MNCWWCGVHLIEDWEQDRVETEYRKKRSIYLGRRWEVVNIHRGIFPIRVGRQNAWLCSECGTDKINGYGKKHAKERRKKIERYYKRCD